jgi:putative transposase
MPTNRTIYSSDLTDAEWSILEPMLPPEKDGGRHRAYQMREVINAIQYVLRSGCAWRLLPHDLPHWRTVSFAKISIRTEISRIEIRVTLINMLHRI